MEAKPALISIRVFVAIITAIGYNWIYKKYPIEIMNSLDARLKNLSPRIISLLSEIDNLNGQWIGGANLSPQALGRLKRSVLVTSTGSSNRIEGSNLSDAEIEKLMRGLSTQKMTDRDEQEAQGYYELLRIVFDQYRGIEFSENVIKQLHAELLKYANKDERHRGDYKKLENHVEMRNANGEVLGVLFETTPAYLVDKEMHELIDWAVNGLEQKTHHQLLIIANFIVQFLKIHPFLDGNGRMSRILTNLLMLKNGFGYMPYVSHEKIIEDNKTEYYVALRQSQASFGKKSETVEPWLEFFLETLRVQAEQAIGLLSGESIINLLSPNQLLVWGFVSANSGDFAIRDVVESTNVARPTVKQALERLLELKLVTRAGLGSATRYCKK